ncbi:hypothetical protein [Nostoc sp. FACHB-280]|uniref:hypothetical protein n=1 Tax=Nostoc sp. FACHB-280 TaxID=2692839 RepID=UPI00168B671E|nr:hypothetical protein [Nostoc sp. FACHB-280]MBD2497898.1 hypothetical protein [Nostoc sp. FACHB-280]
MPKKILPDKKIYVAVEMLGEYINGKAVVKDERNNELLDPTIIDNKIKIYEREVKEWFLKPAKNLLSQDSFVNAFIALMVCMSYFEGVEQYKTGMISNGRSKDYFKNSIKRIYPDKSFQNSDLNKLYSKTRCGLFHNGMVKGGVIFNNNYPEPIEFINDGELIKVNPTQLLQDIQNDFENYINELKSTDSDKSQIARQNFAQMFSVL